MTSALSRMQALRRAVNLVNGTTAAGLLAARIGRVRVRSGPGGLLLAGGWELPLPHAAAFTVGNVVLYRSRVAREFDVAPASSLLRHEARHSSQYAVLGPAFLPLYFAAAGFSKLRTGDPASSNIFEILAGLSDGGYRPRPMRREVSCGCFRR
ncbi:hypothetical protein LOC59_09630 [Arthrobacter sp. zg-Y916]|uniref:DUF4157 domain-containing protein n=1 Tax=Arthrobacter caoxuetaonis TaxID=2886935 RepID=A0A9X1SBW1_9MICC|nr:MULTISPECIES: hypothetical protein [Arthrobacter]MCC3297011.1 hypothetical protein [Arthrobacter caoxuetaonis]MCC9193898.1 hypothetical protein [Arthrobacter sp. zg-Y916]USQ58418.1 hypothetical protein NF551_06210 [Arthrobacter caoxuetaonis]